MLATSNWITVTNYEMLKKLGTRKWLRDKKSDLVNINSYM